MYTVALWDWNGTLLNDVDENVRIVNALLERRSLPKVSKETYKRHFRMPIKDFYRDIGFDLSNEPFGAIAEEYNALYSARFGAMPLTAGIETILGLFSDLKIRQYIVSASEQKSLLAQVSEKKISKYFSKIVGNDDYSVVSKIEKAKELCREFGDGDRLLVIGDLYHDYEVARAVGADCVLYANGHQETDEGAGYRRIAAMGELRDLIG